MNPTFADLLTPTGVVIAAGVVTALIELLKGVFPMLDARVSGALMAFVLTAIIYVLAAISTSIVDLNGGLLVFMAWLSCATSSVGIKSGVSHAVNVGTGDTEKEVPPA